MLLLELLLHNGHTTVMPWSSWAILKNQIQNTYLSGWNQRSFQFLQQRRAGITQIWKTKDTCPASRPELPTPHRSSLDFIAWDYSTLGSSVQYFPFSPGCPRNSSEQCWSDTHRAGSFASGQCSRPLSLDFSHSQPLKTAEDTSQLAIKK